MIVEPAAALGIAAILENRERFQAKTVATILCGANVIATDSENWVKDGTEEALATIIRNR